MPTLSRSARRSFVHLLTAVACLAPAAGLAQAAEAKVAPEAQKVVDAFGKFYAGLKGYRVAVTVELQIEQMGRKQVQTFDQKFAAERPNRISYQLDSQRGGATLVSDGKEMSLFINGFDKYAVEPAAPSFAALFENPLVQGTVGLGNAAVVTMAMLSDDPAKKLLEKVDSLEYGGVVDLGEAKCHLLKATTADLDWQLWIDAGKQPLVRQFLPDLEKAFARLAKGNNQKSPFEGMKITNTVSYKDWAIDPKFGPDDFVFKAPEGAERVESFMAIMQREEPAPHALVGQPAPPIELALLDGGKLDLASHRGKNIVILDFWATWCGPCVQAMPVIDKVAEKFKDKGVLLFAVNLEEGADEINAFLKENKLDVSIALDSDGTVGRAYLAEAIPQTVLVGKDGTVQVVKVGASADLEQSLTKDLEGLIAGKNLAADTLAEAKKRAERREKAAAKPDAEASDAKPATPQPAPEK